MTIEIIVVQILQQIFATVSSVRDEMNQKSAIQMKNCGLFFGGRAVCDINGSICDEVLSGPAI